MRDLSRKDKCIDLHCHSNASDGTLPPEELIARAASLGLKAIALTDHDTIAGLEGAAKAAGRHGIEFINGVELSLNCDDISPWGQMHMVGLFIDPENRRLREGLEFLRKKRRERIPRIIERLEEMGVGITEDMVLTIAGDSAVGRPHLARALIEAGAVGSIQGAFDRYLKKGAPGYVPKEKFDMTEAIPMILEAGGLPVLAHPKYMRMENHLLGSLLDELRAIGLKGIEVYYSEHTPEETELYLRMAAERDLLVSGGSDFHGSNKPSIELGAGKGNLCIPYSLLETMKKHVQGK